LVCVRSTAANEKNDGPDILSVVELLGVLHSLKEKGKPSCSDFNVTQCWGTFGRVTGDWWGGQ